MEDPTFRLEGVVRTRSDEDLEDFEGPLTLILQLLAKNKIEIQDIQISQLLDQYMAYLDEMKAMDLEIASEFVVMASHLVYIKARMLINSDEESEELEELRQSLEKLKSRDIYENLKLALPALESMYNRGAGTLTKSPEYIEPDKEYKYIHQKEDLSDALARVFSRDSVTRSADMGKILIPQRIVYSVTEKTNELIESLKRSGPRYLGLVFKESHSKTELVATFLALLELCRAGTVLLEGEGDETVVSYIYNE